VDGSTFSQGNCLPWQISRWDFELEGGGKGGFEWTDYKAVGPLDVSTGRIADEGGVVIRLADVEAKR
jgi:hypothetical protein